MQFIDVFRMHFDTDREYFKTKTPLGVRGDWAVDPEPATPGNWHRVGTRTCNIDFSRTGLPVPDYAPATWGGVGHESILSYGKITEPFIITTADGHTWRVLDLAYDFWNFLYARLEYLGQFDHHAN